MVSGELAGEGLQRGFSRHGLPSQRAPLDTVYPLREHLNRVQGMVSGGCCGGLLPDTVCWTRLRNTWNEPLNFSPATPSRTHDLVSPYPLNSRSEDSPPKFKGDPQKTCKTSGFGHLKLNPVPSLPPLRKQAHNPLRTPRGEGATGLASRQLLGSFEFSG